jgi:hypothetical protein
LTPPPFDPREILGVLEKHRVAYVVIGKLAAIIHGTGGVTDGVDICPQIKDANIARLRQALQELGARSADGTELAVDRESLVRDPITALSSPVGEIGIVPEPPGTRGGWDDIRRRANREPVGRSLRVPVAAVEDLARIAAADSGADSAQIDALRRVAELSRGRGASRSP